MTHPMIIQHPPGYRFLQALYFERRASDIMGAAEVQAGRVRAAIAKRIERIRGLMEAEGSLADYSLEELVVLARSPEYEYTTGFMGLAPQAALIIAEAAQLASERQLAERLCFISKHLVGESERTITIKMILEDALVIFDEYAYREQPQPDVGPVEAEDNTIHMMPPVARRGGLRGVVGAALHTQGGGYAAPAPLKIADLLKR